MHAVTLLATLQATGALIGVSCAVWSEVAYLRAAADGAISAAEQAHLRIVGRGLRFGLLLVLFSSLGLVVRAYVARATVQPALTASYWVLVSLALLIVALSSALARKRVPFLLGSAAAFTAWWFLAYLSLGLLPIKSFGSAIALYVIVGAVLYALIAFTRMRFTTSPQNRLI